MTNEISNSEDVIDSRDVIARIEELEGRNAPAEVGEGVETDDLDESELAELIALKALAKEAEDYSPDWRHGAPLIRDSYFTDYAEERAKDCGLIPDNLAWPFTCIDWEEAARQLKQDYTSVDFDGVAYWVQ